MFWVILGNEFFSQVGCWVAQGRRKLPVVVVVPGEEGKKVKFSGVRVFVPWECSGTGGTGFSCPAAPFGVNQSCLLTGE